DLEPADRGQCIDRAAFDGLRVDLQRAAYRIQLSLESFVVDPGAPADDEPWIELRQRADHGRRSRRITDAHVAREREVEPLVADEPAPHLDGPVRLLDTHRGSLRDVARAASHLDRAQVRVRGQLCIHPDVGDDDRRLPSGSLFHRSFVQRLNHHVGTVAVVTFRQFRKLCLSMPEAEELETWGEATFRVRGKIFAMGSSEGSSVSVKASLDDQSGLVAMDLETFAVSADTGRFGR